MKRRTRKEWEKLVESQRSGGKSIREFCREEDVGYQSLLAWKRKLKAADSSLETESFVEIPVIVKHKEECLLDGENIFIHHPSGITVELRGNPKKETIRFLIQVLGIPA